MRPAARLLAAAFLALAPAAPAADAAETSPEAARGVVSELLSRAQEATAAEGLEAEARRAQVEAALGEAFDFEVWEDRVLAEDALSESERATFRELLPRFLARLWVEKLGADAGAPEITGAQPLRDDVLVSTELPRPSGPLPVAYRLRTEEGGAPEVIDITIGGTSYALLMRDQFKKLLDEEGAEGLFAYMRGNGS